VKEYQAVLFDMDGTLVNSEPLKGLALSLACKDYGCDVDVNIYQEVMGENWSIVTDHFFKHGNISPDLTAFNQHFRGHYECLLAEDLNLNAGALEYIQHLKSSGKRCGVVSSAATWMVDNILGALNLSGLFDIIIAKEHVCKHKPDPEAYQLALAQLDIAAEDTLIFEDSSAGVEAGIASGCDVIAIAHNFNGQNDLSKALKVIASYDEMRV